MERMLVRNPVITGFAPDPAMIRVGKTYYIATSTFEWYPGVRIYSSTDLKNWSFAAAPLAETRLLSMEGIGASEGIWAADLSFWEDRFYLVYTVVTNQGRIKDLSNYVITAKKISGPWSDRVYLNSSGFDPSLFHGEDGRKWLVNMEWDYRKGNGPECFTGILLQEYSEMEKGLIGSPKKIFKGTELGYVEGPHIYAKDGYYYLFCAEGGTSYDHAVTVARSRELEGPYEVHPCNPVLTSGKDDYLQKAGHGSLCQGTDGSWYLAHLCARPLPGTKACTLGRETAIQEIVWKDDWPVLKHGVGSKQKSDVYHENIAEGCHPSEWFEAPANVVMSKSEESLTYEFYSFDSEVFWKDFQTLRVGHNEDDYSLKARPGWLRLRGKNGVTSRFEQTLLGRRQKDFSFAAATEMEFTPEHFQQGAGLMLRYNEENLYYLQATYDEEEQGPVLQIVRIYAGNYSVEAVEKVQGDRFLLGIQVENTKGCFFWAYPGEFVQENPALWRRIGSSFDVTNLSDDFTYGFTGTFLCICAQDLQSHKKSADFHYLKYMSIDYK